MAEAYRNIRTSIFFSTPAGGGKVLAVTSCGPGEGKTTTATNLAVAIAKSGKKILLVDADFHRPMVDKILKLNKTAGLSTVLVGEAELKAVIQNVEYEGAKIEGLDVAVAGPPSPNPSELLGSQRMSQLLSEVRDSYDWVLVDTPPILFVSDASILSALCDGVILVVRAGVNNRSMLNRTREHLENIKVKIVGSVLNQMVVGRFGRYYSHYYYHGYSRYSRDYHRSYYPAVSDKTTRSEGLGKDSKLL
jgi:capsular exopolysaccharide synthesis family protein